VSVLREFAEQVQAAAAQVEKAVNDAL